MSTQQEQLEAAFEKVMKPNRTSNAINIAAICVAGFVAGFAIPAYAAVGYGLIAEDCIFCFMRNLINQ